MLRNLIVENKRCYVAKVTATIWLGKGFKSAGKACLLHGLVERREHASNLSDAALLGEWKTRRRRQSRIGRIGPLFDHRYDQCDQRDNHSDGECLETAVDSLVEEGTDHSI